MRCLVAALVVVVLAAAGCGGGGGTTTTSASNGMASKPPAQVLAASVKAAESATSVHVSGSVPSGGQPIVLDLTVYEGKGSKGSLTVSGQQVDLIIMGNDGYLKAGKDFWDQFAGSGGAMIASLLDGKWLKFPVNNPQFQQLVAFSSSKAFFEALKSADSQLKNKGATTYKGQNVVALDDGEKDGTLYVAAEGKPYPAALVQSGSDGGEITFSDWNEPVSLAAPKDAVDFSQFSG